jgi:hypothetical protein
MENFGPESEQLPNADDRRRAEQLKVARSLCHNTKMWLHVDARLWVQRLTGYRVDNQLSIPSWETNGTVSFNRVGDVTESTAHIHLPLWLNYVGTKLHHTPQQTVRRHGAM